MALPSPEPPGAAGDAAGGSVTAWIGDLKDGDPAAAQRLWERYFRRMAALARRRMGGHETPTADDEDVALSAFHSFCAGADAGKFPRLADRTDLWPLLAAITGHKAADHLARERRLKRGGGSGREALDDLDALVGPAPPPDALAEVEDYLGRLLDGFGDPALREITRLRLEGHSVEEVAARLGVALRTVERKLRIIRYLLVGGGSKP